MRASRIARALLITLGIVIARATAASAEWQVKPFLGGTYGGSSSYILVPQTGAPAHLSFGTSALWLGEVFGVEGDVAHTIGFFQDPNYPAPTDSGVTTATGNVVVALPRHLAQYTLRPYIVGGAGVMHVAIDIFSNPAISSTLKTMDLGAGVTGFLTNRIGVSWDVRYFRSIDRTIESGQSIGSEHLSFWRASMAVAIRL